MNILKLCKNFVWGSKNKKLGFTLTELVIVLALISIVSGTIWTSVRAVQRRTLQSASLMVQADLRRIQRLAVIEGRNYEITIANLEYDSFYIIFAGNEPLERVNFPPGVRMLRTSLYSNTVRYLPRGTIGGDGPFTMTLAKGPFEQTITTTLSGGRVRISAIELS